MDFPLGDRAMLTGGWGSVLVYYLYAILSCTEVAVLLLSAAGVSVFVIKEIAREIDHVLAVATRDRRLDTQRPSKARHRRSYQVVGAHNERF